MNTEVQTDRRAFLRRLGQTLLAGVGLVLATARPAQALVNCCRDSSCPSCPGSNVRYRCSACPPPNCVCLPPGGTCVQIGTCP